MRLKDLDEKIEFLREQLYKLAKSRDYRFMDAEVLRLSEKIDALLVRRERCKIERSDR